MPKKTPKTPQQKKSLSYDKDRRNTYGENDKASRKAIPRRKAGENRKLRRNAKQAVTSFENTASEEFDTTESSLRKGTARLGGWKKAPDRPLKDHVENKMKARTERSKSARREYQVKMRKLVEDIIAASKKPPSD